MLKRIGFAAGAAVAMIIPLLVGTATTAGAAPNQGVTSTTIKVGVPYIDHISLLRGWRSDPAECQGRIGHVTLAVTGA